MNAIKQLLTTTSVSCNPEIMIRANRSRTECHTMIFGVRSKLLSFKNWDYGLFVRDPNSMQNNRISGQIRSLVQADAIAAADECPTTGSPRNFNFIFSRQLCLVYGDTIQ